MRIDRYLNLDNPVWYALQSAHKRFAYGSHSVKRYPVDMLKIIGCELPSTADLGEIEPWAEAGENFFIVGELPFLPKNWQLNSRLDCVQMVCNKLTASGLKSDQQIILLTESHREEMLELINLVQPGYFFKNTPLLGNYFGIILDNKLVAMAGERLKMTGFTEISAVVTHPQHTGKGYAQHLVAHVSQQNIDKGVSPFLHFVNSNTRARKVYEILGYTERKIIPFWQVQFNGREVIS